MTLSETATIINPCVPEDEAPTVSHTTLSTPLPVEQVVLNSKLEVSQGSRI